MAPAIPIALRLSGHLLLGVCRIYSRKVFYLYSESNDALVKTKMAFKTGALVDLPSDQQTAQLSTITLADTSTNADLDLPPIPTQMSLDDLVANDLDGDNEMETARRDSWVASGVSFNARKADITLAEDDGGIGLGQENMELLDPSVDQGDFFTGGGEAFDIDKTMDPSIDDIEIARKDEEAGPEFELDQGAVFDPSPGGVEQSFAAKSARQSDIQGVADDISIRMSD